jgi:hypothetical protein
MVFIGTIITPCPDIQKFVLEKTSIDRVFRKNRDPVLRSKSDRDRAGFAFDRDHDRDCSFKIAIRLRNENR